MAALTDGGLSYAVDPDAVTALVFDALVGSIGLVVSDTTGPGAVTGAAAWTEAADVLSAAGSVVGEWNLSDYYVHVNDYGAVPDSTAAGAGTDSTAAFQAALDDVATGGNNSGKIVLVGPGNYKLTGPITIHEGGTIMSPQVLQTATASFDSVGYATRIDFHGGPTDHCIQTLGGTGSNPRSVSKAAVFGLMIVDRRTSSTAGDGISFLRTVNDVQIKNCAIFGFSTGSSISITSQSGSSSDCVDIELIWTLGAKYGIRCHNIDNQLDIRHIKCDTPVGSPTEAVIYLTNISAVARVRAVKHENMTTAVTVMTGPVVNSLNIDGITLRLGQSGTGPAVRLNGSGNNVRIRGIWRQFTGPLIDVIGGNATQTISGNHIDEWLGGGSTYRFNKAYLYGDSTSPNVNRIGVGGQLYAVETPAVLPGHNGAKLAVRTNSTAAPAVTVHQLTSQTGDLQTFYDTAGAVLLRVKADGDLEANQDVRLGGTGKTVGFYGSAGATKGTISGDTAAATSAVLSDLLAYLASLGLLTDSTT